jgi:hypothetical protein
VETKVVDFFKFLNPICTVRSLIFTANCLYKICNKKLKISSQLDCKQSIDHFQVIFVEMYLKYDFHKTIFYWSFASPESMN